MEAAAATGATAARMVFHTNISSHPTIKGWNEKTMGGGEILDIVFDIYSHQAVAQWTSHKWPAHKTCGPTAHCHFSILVITNYIFSTVSGFYQLPSILIHCFFLLLCYISKHWLRGSNKKQEKFRERQQCTERPSSWRNTSVPIALLILAQISIACKELLTSLKQAILIKARIINSDLRTPRGLKIGILVPSEAEVGSKSNVKVKMREGGKVRKWTAIVSYTWHDVCKEILFSILFSEKWNKTIFVFPQL